MRLGVAMPLSELSGAPLGSKSWSAGAQRIEQLGYRSLWTFDAVGRGFLLPDPLMALAIAASTTDHIELGTGVMQLPIRNVVEVAHRLLTLQTVAPGRVLFGVGPGSTEADFALFGGDYSERFGQFESQWKELQQWVSDGSIGDRSLGADASLLNGPALMLAGWRGSWVERAASESAGWIASAHYADDAQLADGLARFRDSGGSRAIVTNLRVGDDLAPAIDRANHLAEVGFDDVVVFDVGATDERLATIRTEVPDR